MSNVIGLDHRHCPCICHVIPLECSVGRMSPTISFVLNYTIVGSVRSSHCISVAPTSQSTKRSDVCSRLFVALSRSCLRSDKSKPFSSADERVVETFCCGAPQRSPGRRMKIHERSTRATALYVYVRYMRQCRQRRCHAASARQFQMLDESHRICASVQFRGCVTGGNYFLARVVATVLSRRFFPVPRARHR